MTALPYPTKVGNFTLTGVLGSGGMGAVFLAEHNALGAARLAAFKFLKPEYSANADVRRRFYNEAKAAASLNHPNIMPVLDFGEVEGWLYIQMPYYEGRSFARLVADRGALPAHELAAIMSDICAGVQAAHDKGIIHRDLKPDNIWICNPHGEGQRALVLDFGIAKLNDEMTGGTKTKTGIAVGTPVYMSPEALGGEPVTTASDVFALGAIYYYGLTGGTHPFQRDDEPPEVFHTLTMPALYVRQVNAHEYGMPIDPRRRNPSISEAMAAIALRAVDRYPAKRIQSARELGILIKNVSEVRGIVNLLETVRSTRRASDAAASSKYKLEKKLGEGGMAEVFLGSIVGAAGFSRPICIKRVLPEYSNQPSFAKMFIDEAQIAARLQHPNVVAVLDFDRDPDGRLFIAMEYVPGKDLAALVETGPLPPAIVVHLAIEMLSGLAAAHKQQVVHRDISPHNILVSWDGIVKVSDFGIAKALDKRNGIHSGTLKGKPSYMSPEQIDCVPDLDGRSDLYAIGVTLWELLTGRRLYTGSYEAIFSAIKYRDPPTPSSVVPGVPRDLDAIVMKLLARDRERRYRTAEDVIADLRRCTCFLADGGTALAQLLAHRFSGTPSAAAVAAPHADPSVPTRSAPTSDLRAPAIPPNHPSTLRAATGQSVPNMSAPATTRRSRAPLWLAGGVVAAAAVAIVAVVTVRGSDTTPTPGTGSSEPHAASASPDGGGHVVAVIAADAGPAAGSAAIAPTGLSAGSASAPSDAAVTATAHSPVSKPPVNAGSSTSPASTSSPDPARATAAAPKRFGLLTVTSDPWCDVYINGKRLQSTPVIQRKIPEGVHDVVLVIPNPDGKPAKRDKKKVTIVPNKETVIDKTW